VVSEITVTKLLATFLETVNGIISFKIAVTSNCNGTLHLKLGD
jgi:hypothetical protein